MLWPPHLFSASWWRAVKEGNVKRSETSGNKTESSLPLSITRATHARSRTFCSAGHARVVTSQRPIASDMSMANLKCHALRPGYVL